MPKARLEHNKALPKRWAFTHGAYYYQVPVEQQTLLGKTRVHLGRDIATAHATFKDVQRCMAEGLSWNKVDRSQGVTAKTPTKRELSWGATATAGIPNRFLKELWYGTKNRAKRRGTECTLTFDDMLTLARRANGRCELTRIHWDLNSIVQGGMKRPWIPSLDRRNASQGYTMENCRMVCWAVNVALNEWGEAVLRRIVTARLAKSDESMPQMPR